jgi:glutaconate CoA-transferase subunit B
MWNFSGPLEKNHDWMFYDLNDVEYRPVEMMAVAASRTLEDKKSVFVGTGLPMIAAILAQKTHAPDLLIVFESGGVGASVPTLPLGVGDSRTFHKATMAGSMCDVVEASQTGYVDFGFLGGAQLDKYGNLNATCIGQYENPKVTLPGSGGGNDIGSLCWRTIITTIHEKRRFVEKVDFVTTPGYLTGPGAREAAGLPKGTGPYRVVTNLAVLGYEEKTKRMMLLSVHPGLNVEQVVENTGFELILPERVEVTEPPRAEELKLLREEIDPKRIYISR